MEKIKDVIGVNKLAYLIQKSLGIQKHVHIESVMAGTSGAKLKESRVGAGGILFVYYSYDEEVMNDSSRNGKTKT